MSVAQSQQSTLAAAASVDTLGAREPLSGENTRVGRMQGPNTSHAVEIATDHCNVQPGTGQSTAFNIDIRSAGDSGARPNVSKNPEPTGLLQKFCQFIARLFERATTHGASAGSHSALQHCSTTCSSAAHLRQSPATVQDIQETPTGHSCAARMAHLMKTSVGSSSKQIENAEQARNMVVELDRAVQGGEATSQELLSAASRTCRKIGAQVSGTRSSWKPASQRFDDILDGHLASVRRNENSNETMDWSELEKPDGDVRKALQTAFQSDAGQKDGLVSRTLTKIVRSAATTKDEKRTVDRIIKEIKASVVSPRAHAEQATHRLLAELSLMEQSGVITSADRLLKLMRSVRVAIKNEVKANSHRGNVSERSFVEALDKHLASIRSDHKIQGTDYEAWENHHMGVNSDSMQALGMAQQAEAKPGAQDKLLSRTIERVLTSFGATPEQHQEIFDHIQSLKPQLRNADAS